MVYTSVPGQALDAYEMGTLGQVAVVEVARVDDVQVGLLLVIERGINEAPKSALIVIPGPDQATWRLIDLPDAPGAMATGDVTGDGRDEIAVVHHFDGAECPFAGGGQMPCGVVRIYDAEAIVQGQLETVAKVQIRPQPTSCTPSNYPPSALSLRDVTGDGHAELAMGQLALQPGHCGVVHVIPGERLSGSVELGSACARIEGPLIRENHAPDQFGVHLQLYTADAAQEKAILAVGAPHASNASNEETPVSGRVALYDLTSACKGSSLLGPSKPDLITERYGSVRSHQLGASMALVEDLLWVSGQGGVLGLDPVTLEQEYAYPTQRSFPLRNAGDVTGDGQDELMAGHWVMTPHGQVVMALDPFAHETFRGAVLSPDHIVASDKFGSRIWSLTDLWTPNLELAHDPQTVYNGGTLNVSISQVTSIVPIHDPLSWSITGGTVTQNGGSWVHVQTESPGHVVVQAHLGPTTETLRVPVLVPEDEIDLTGPSSVLASHPFTVRVNAPANTTIEWDAPDAEPSQGAGRTIEIQYDNPGTHTIQVQGQFPDGAIAMLQHEVRVLEAGFELDVPGQILQGEQLEMSVIDPEEELEYVWFLEGERMGPLSATGTDIAVPVAGWGPLNVTVTAHMDNEPVAAAHAQVQIENLPPRIDAFHVQTGHTVEGLMASISARDPGGDPLTINWFIDGQPAGTGSTLRAPNAEGLLNLTVVVTDDGGLSTEQSRQVDVAPDWVEVLDEDGDRQSRTETSTNRSEEDTQDETQDPGAQNGGRSIAENVPGVPLVVFLVVLALTGSIVHRRRGQGDC